MKTTNVKNQQLSLDLQLQRDYVANLESKGFDYGLVLADAFVKGMRDIGYKSTAFALDELIDNAIQAGARDVHVAFGYGQSNTSKKKPDMIAVVDNGHGMDPMMIRASVIWGGTHRHNDRKGFGRYGYGLPSACVSIGRKYTVMSRVEGGEWQAVAVDLEAIETHFLTGNGPVHAEKPGPAFLPKWVESYLAKNIPQMTSGTVVLIEKIDRLDRTTSSSLGDTLLKEFGITYRNFLDEVNIGVDGKKVEPTDPLFLTPGRRYYDEHAKPSEKATALPPHTIEVSHPETKKPLGVIKVRYSLMPPAFWRLGGKEEQNKARFNIRKENNGILVLRAGRQIDVVSSKCPWLTFVNYDRHIGVELDFSPHLDEEFSITTSKQQVVISDRVWAILAEKGVRRAISEMRSKVKEAIEAEEAKHKDGDGPRESESAFEQAKKHFAQAPSEPTPRERRQAEENFERDAETLAETANIPTEQAKQILEEQAKVAPVKVRLESMPGAPFYRFEQSGGQQVLSINRAHRFFTDLYASPQATTQVRYALDALLMVMGERELRANEATQLFYIQERAAWSVNLETTMRLMKQAEVVEDLASLELEISESQQQ